MKDDYSRRFGTSTNTTCCMHASSLNMLHALTSCDRVHHQGFGCCMWVCLGRKGEGGRWGFRQKQPAGPRKGHGTVISATHGLLDSAGQARPTLMPMPFAPRSPMPRMRSPSVTTAILTSSSGQFASTSGTCPCKHSYCHSPLAHGIDAMQPHKI